MKKLFHHIVHLFRTYPKPLYVLFYTEMWELFGRAGIMAILALYLTKTFHFSDTKAFSIYSGFLALIYVMPIIGGLLCDKILGNRHAIILGGVVMLLGNLFLAYPQPFSVYIGLSMIVLGSGFFLPSITPLVGQLYEKNPAGRDAGFTLYYLGRNIGFLMAPILCGLVATYAGYHYAFLLSAIGMCSGLIVYIRGRHCLAPFEKKIFHQTKTFLRAHLFLYASAIISLPVILCILFYNVSGYVLLITGIGVLIALGIIAFRRNMVERKHILAIVCLMVFVIIFESFLNQGGMTLSLFIDRIINRKMFGFVVPTPFFYSLDPIFMMALGPLLSIFWLFLAKRNREPLSSTKFVSALFLLGIGFLIFVFAASHAIMNGLVSPVYVVVAFFIFPMAEICIVPIGLSLVTRLAPRGLSAMMVGVWMLSSAASGFFTGQIAKLGNVSFAVEGLVNIKKAANIYFHLFTICSVSLILAAFVLLILKPLIKKLIAVV